MLLPRVSRVAWMYYRSTSLVGQVLSYRFLKLFPKYSESIKHLDRRLLDHRTHTRQGRSHVPPPAPPVRVFPGLGTAMFPFLILADQASDAMGNYGALANLTALTAIILLACAEVMYLRPKREDRQQAANDRVQQLFLAECQAGRDAHREAITELRTESRLQRDEMLRMYERNCEATAGLATAVNTLSERLVKQHA